jgi:uncharacterized protein (DUF2267 family)
MKYEDFVGQVQNRARLASTGDALKATAATLQTLGQRLAGGEAGDMAAQLPSAIKIFLHQEGDGERFDLIEFYWRVSVVEGVELRDAALHARAVISVLKEAISPGELADMRAQLPEEFDPLFEWEGPGMEKRAA